MIRYYIFSLLVLLLDQWTKWLIVKKMNVHESITVIDRFLYITSHRNKGAAWGILQDQMMFFYIITVLVVVGIIYYMHTHARNEPITLVALSFILGGALGNFIDRLFRQEVVDFIDVMIFSYDYPIFNIADSFLVIGVGIIIVAIIFEERLNKKESKD